MATISTGGQSSGVPTNGENDKPGLLRRWINYVTTNPKRVLLIFVVCSLLFAALSMSIKGEFSDSFNLPGSESQQAYDLLAESFPQQSGSTASLVFQTTAPGGITDPAIQAQIQQVLTEAAALPHVATIASPFDFPQQISEDGTIAYATVNYDLLSNDMTKTDAMPIVDLTEASQGDQLVVEVGGDVVALTEQEFGNTAELVGISAAAVILLVAFGSVVAMGLPIITALIGLFLGFLGIFIATNYLDIATFAPAFASMIGIGVGIDYALFIVTRFREGLAEGQTPKEATARALDTAGRAVIFAGTVVIISMLGLSAVGIQFVAALGIAAAIVVGTAVLVAFTILPVMLVLIGKRIDKWSIRHPKPEDEQGVPFGRKLSNAIQAHPLRYALLSGGLLILLALPVLQIELGFPNAGANPTSYHTRQAYDLMTEGFGAGFSNPLLIVMDNPAGVTDEQLQQTAQAVSQQAGVVEVGSAFKNDTGDVAVLNVIPTGDANSQEVKDLVKNLRDETLPSVVADSGTTPYVGGATATFLDFSGKMVDRTPYVFIVIIGLSFVLLTIVFRSPVIAVKAAIMNMLSIAAAFGLVVAVFQKGWGGGLIGVEESQPVAVFLPIFLFAILFGLSMDYEVFLLSRIREFWAHGVPTSDAVADGLAVTARVITAAAAIMVCVFLSFVFTPDPITKQMGFGLAVAILIDATVVRLVLVPSTMELLGEWNWWFPSWLDRITPHVNIEGKTDSIPGEFEPVAGIAD